MFIFKFRHNRIQNQLYICIQKIVPQENYKNSPFEVFLLEVISIYYNLNIWYPEEVSQSFEFFKRYFLRHSTTYRGAKKKINRKLQI